MDGALATHVSILLLSRHAAGKKSGAPTDVPALISVNRHPQKLSMSDASDKWFQAGSAAA
jgi:hypothetical protein